MRLTFEQRGDSLVLKMHDGGTKSILLVLFDSFISERISQVVRKVVEMFDVDLENLGCHRAGISVRQRNFHSCIAQGGEVSLDWRCCAGNVC